MFESFGVGADAESLYRFMLDHPGLSRARLSVEWGRTHEITEGLLGELDGLGLVVQDPRSEPCALAPERAIDILIAREEEALDDRRRQLQATRASIPELVDVFVESRRQYVSRDVELLTDSALVRSRLYQLATEAEASVWALQPDRGLTPEAMAAARPLDHDLRARDVACRLVVTASSLHTPGWLGYLHELQQIGQQVRVAGTVSQRCIIVDGHTAVIPSSDHGSPGAYVLHGHSLVAPVVALFEEIWLHAGPVPQDGEDRSSSTPERMREVAALLALGIKDEAVARRLGVSVRTVRRLIAATMTELRTDSRFQAGVAAVRRGWLTVDGEPPDGER